jgi:protein-L-isoaspartate O-methyltransferase
MTTRVSAELRSTLQQWDEASWCLAAVALAAEGHEEYGAPARKVLAAAGLLDHEGRLPLPPGTTPAQVAAQAAAPLMQVGAAVGGLAHTWMALPDEALVAQGEASGQMAQAVRQSLPMFPGLAERFARGDARMLDVGTGIGAIASAMAEVFPGLRVTGIDVSDRVLQLGRLRLAGLPVADRVELRLQDVVDVDETDAYDFAWVPAPFVPEDALRSGMTKVAAALRPGGWAVVGHGKLGEEQGLQQALTRFKTVVYGGTPLDDREAVALLTGAGLVDARALPTPPGAPAVTVARKP